MAESCSTERTLETILLGIVVGGLAVFLFMELNKNIILLNQQMSMYNLSQGNQLKFNNIQDVLVEPAPKTNTVLYQVERDKDGYIKNFKKE